MESRYTKTILKGYSVSELQELATSEGLVISGKTRKTVILRQLFSHFGIENERFIQQREMRLVEAYFDAFSFAVTKADQDTESILAIILNPLNKTFKIECNSQITVEARSEFVEKFCNHCQKNGKEIKDCKLDYYASHFLFEQLTRLEKNAFGNRITDPAFEGLDKVLGTWILSARLEKVLEGTYSANSRSCAQSKEGFLLFRAYFTKKHALIGHLWSIIQNCLKIIDCEKKFAKPTTKQNFLDICNWTRLHCQQHISGTVFTRTLHKSSFCKMNEISLDTQMKTQAVHIIYENKVLNDSLEWELQMKEATIVSLQEKLKLLQWEMNKLQKIKMEHGENINTNRNRNNNDGEDRKMDNFLFNASDCNCSWECSIHNMEVDSNNSFIDNYALEKDY